MSLVIDLFYKLLVAYSALILIDIIISWFPMLYRYGFFRLVHKVTNAYMGFFEGFLTVGMFDFTPIVGIILFELLTKAFVWLI